MLEPAAPELAAVEKMIRESLDSGDESLKPPAAHLLARGGKRLRPALVILSALCYRYDAQHVIPAAAAVEMIHTATLIHDDIIDGSNRRRGMPSVNDRWGIRTALLAGDYLFARAFAMLAGIPPAAFAGLASAAEEMCAGQARELGEGDDRVSLLFSDSGERGEREYFLRIESKTARFLSECCRIGSLLGRAPAAAGKALADYGRFLGIAFQITDDALDVFGDPAQTGKPAGVDLREGLLTLPVIRCLKTTPKRGRFAELLNCFGRQHPEGACDPADLAEALAILRESDSAQYCSGVARTFALRAADRLTAVRSCPARTSLERLTEFVVARAY